MRKLLVPALLVALTGCATTPPSDPDNLCSIFREKRSWYRDSKRAAERWGTPIHVQMAILHQESTFRANARPERTKLLWVIPWTRPSSAYGYAQVKDETWAWYIDKTGNYGADRDDFDDAVDFVAWYAGISHQVLGLSKWDARNQYLAYHEGHGGYKRGSYRRKGWLVSIADQVEARARRYGGQLKSCEKDLDRGWWPF